MLFWYLKISVLLSFVAAAWPPKRHTTEKSPITYCDTRKNPSPDSEFHEHDLSTLRPACEV